MIGNVINKPVTVADVRSEVLRRMLILRSRWVTSYGTADISSNSIYCFLISSQDPAFLLHFCLINVWLCIFCNYFCLQ